MNVKWLVEVLSSPEAQAGALLFQVVELLFVAALAFGGWALRRAFLIMEKERKRIEAIAEASRKKQGAFESISKNTIHLEMTWFEECGARVLPHIRCLGTFELSVIPSEQVREEILGGSNRKELPFYENPYCSNAGLFEIPSGIKRVLAPLKPLAESAVGRDAEALRHLKAKRSSFATPAGVDYAVMFIHRDEYKEQGVTKYGKTRAILVALWQIEEIIALLHKDSEAPTDDQIDSTVASWLKRMSPNIPGEAMTLDRPFRVVEAAKRYLNLGSELPDFTQVLLIKI